MAYFRVTITGANELASAFARVGLGSFMRGVSQVAYAEANEIMNKSKRQVPIEDGILRDSGTVNPAETIGDRFKISMGYGGAASAYALIQHENMAFHHPGLHSKRKGQVGRKAKYLEDPMRDAGPTLERKMADMLVNYFRANGL
jgi:hypothetical protein